MPFYLGAPIWALLPLGVFVLLYLIFRDPRRPIPAAALGVVSPVDGCVAGIDRLDSGVLQGSAWRVVIRIDAFGTYSARSPVEGRIMDLAASGDELDYPTNALWLQTDEGDDVVLRFRGYRFGLPPRSFARFGERLGQGRRCGYLRLTRFAELHLPVDSKIVAAEGDRVVAGTTVVATLHRS